MFAVMDMINGLLGTGQDMAWVGAIITAALTIGVGPAVIMLVVKLLSLPILRQACYGPVFLAGKIASATLTRWLGSRGEALEDAIQDFLVYLLNGFFKGLDHDDLVAKDRQHFSEVK